ncbi:hypothetical protein NCAS_0G02360 [Naumovozyma castellii]|uniref:Mitochondrial import receptor subunit TOM22 n=1 Tax=Naumovozyma castellii TaxID=27288 RepID=G0VI88_NAUCA|nr:hypothetical protein NCAS_0G02360 [Naumovozyma castellii CBS 4309]CCC71123.1 hypothetical protein NCAS_0G02360 [Naumovozyma castellii CBS 4309]
MVELSEIKEDTSNVPNHPAGPNEAIIEDNDKPINVEENEEDDEDDSDFEDDFNEKETLLERLSALKDVIPPKQRQSICSVFNFTTNFIKTAFSKSGNVAWIVTTSALLLGVPLSLSILAEQQLIEMEKTFDLQKDANDILAQGDKPE